MKKHSILFIFISLLTFSQAQSQDIDKVINKSGTALLKNKEFKALSIGIYQGGKKYSKHFGSPTEHNKIPPNDDSIYEIASVTKTFTGYLAAKAVLEGRINLDDPVQKYLHGDFSNLALEETPIKIKDLLTHTSGLPQMMDERISKAYESLSPDVPLDVHELEKELTKEKFLERLAAYEIKVVPGTEYSYSNAGTELMGYVLTKVYQKSFDRLLKEVFLDELGMDDTNIELNEEQEERLVKGYWMENSVASPAQLNPLWATGSGLKSTTKDLLAYIAFNLNPDNPILKESQSILYEKNTRWVGYFWNIWKDKHGTSFNHHGGTSGTQNWIYIFPKYDLGITIIVNHSGPKTPRKLNKEVKKMIKQLNF